MEAAAQYRQLALTQHLDAIVTRTFSSSRSGEQRIDVYLELNQLLRVEDTPESVQALRARLPVLLLEFHHDLQYATVNDLLHVCLRTLSYFMYHNTLAATFTNALFLSNIINLLFLTFDEKYPQVVLSFDSTVHIYHEPTWKQARLILKEASRFVAKWSDGVLEELQDCMFQYALSAMKAHMEKERNKSALQLWILILELMKSTLAMDLTILNDILYIPEISMRHEDVSVLLMSMEAWNHLVAVFRSTC
uniref:Telomere-associated protein Rif1 N-terminal domain-containing protein n=1 Tax=Globisporangium ultimum (strain ATCC 200006 / CBS 805.95 / DAOM BR144) TaxID=431595 RepID=K3WKL2_GLOUD